jgi:dipeptidase
MEISGSGKGIPSAIWCAARIPDDHVGVSANIPRISTVDFNNPDLFMYSKDLQNVAKRLGYWDGKEPFKFWKIIGSWQRAFDMREFYILSTLAPSLNLSNDKTVTELPFSIKPENKLSPRDIMKFFRETYEGTQWEMTKDLLVTVKEQDNNGNIIEKKIKSPAVNNWMNWDMVRLLNELKPGIAVNRGPIAQSRCSYSHVIQCRSWLPDEIGAIAWFSFDNPGLSPRIPIFSGVLYLPESFKNCGQYNYRTNAAVWSFRETNKLATINWSYGRKLIEPAIKELEDKAFEEVVIVEKNALEMIKAGKTKKSKEYITSYTNEFALSAMKKWEEMKVSLWSLIGTDFYPLN